ncbi:MAG: SDR family NAD(P)-dependent oxidoreductase [Actinomycetota bacterium]
MGSQSISIITGAGSGINKEIARQLAVDGPVAICDLNAEAAQATAQLIKDEGGIAEGWAMDVADRQRVQTVVSEIADRFGGVDVLINGAGYGQFKSFLDLEEADWDRMFDVHVKGTFNCTQAVIPFMRDKGFGRIVCFSSVGAFSGSPSHSHYAAAKAAVIGFSKALCKEIGPWGITINCVAPGAIETPFLGDISAEALERYSDTPVGRIGQPADVAHTVRFLISPDAGYITGWVVSVNGGIYT